MKNTNFRLVHNHNPFAYLDTCRFVVRVNQCFFLIVQQKRPLPDPWSPRTKCRSSREINVRFASGFPSAQRFLHRRKGFSSSWSHARTTMDVQLVFLVASGDHKLRSIPAATDSHLGTKKPAAPACFWIRSR